MTHKAKTLKYLTNRVGQTTPRSEQAAKDIGCTVDEYTNSCTWLKRHGYMTVSGVGYGRVIHIKGVGSTLPLSNHREARDGIHIPPEPIRMTQSTCPRCGSRNYACGHTASALVVREYGYA